MAFIAIRYPIDILKISTFICSMPKVLISLTPRMLEAVDHLVSVGLYSSRSEVFRDAIRMLMRPGSGLEEELEDLLPELVSPLSSGDPDWVYS